MKYLYFRFFQVFSGSTVDYRYYFCITNFYAGFLQHIYREG